MAKYSLIAALIVLLPGVLGAPIEPAGTDASGPSKDANFGVYFSYAGQGAYKRLEEATSDEASDDAGPGKDANFGVYFSYAGQGAYKRLEETASEE